MLEDAEADVNGVTDAMEKQSITEPQGEGKSYHIWNVMFNYLCNQKLVVYMHISSALCTRIVPYAQNEVILNCQKKYVSKIFTLRILFQSQTIQTTCLVCYCLWKCVFKSSKGNVKWKDLTDFFKLWYWLHNPLHTLGEYLIQSFTYKGCHCVRWMAA